MGGELGIKIAKAYGSREIVRPYGEYSEYIDLTIESATRENLHICGANDWGYLAADILKPVIKEAYRVYAQITNGILKNNPEVILLGRNEYRLIDIYRQLRNEQDTETQIMKVPYVKGDFANGIKYLGSQKEDSFPFEWYA